MQQPAVSKFLFVFLVGGLLCKNSFAQSFILPNRLWQPDTLKPSHKELKIGYLFHGITELSQNLSTEISAGPTVAYTQKKWSFKGLYSLEYLQANAFTQAYMNEYEVLPSVGNYRALGNRQYLGHLLAGELAYNPNDYLSLSLNHSKQFYGSGYRSLLFSDVSSPHLFAKIKATFGKRFIYTFSVAKFQDQNHFNPSRFGSVKYGAFHYFTYNIGKKSSISLFETVMWGARDSLNQRGIDVRYLNPVVFFRPVEYSAGSADNSIVGLNTELYLTPDLAIYGQLVLDEFLLSELKSGNQWWANKYGIQMGAKLNTKLKQKHPLLLRAELNMVRPFTYTHARSLESYTHYNQAIAHPLGANFREFIGLSTLHLNNYIVDTRLIYYEKGLDNIGENNGGNILKSYKTRNRDYGHNLLQGKPLKVALLKLDIYRKIGKKSPLFVQAGIGYRKQSGGSNTALISLGITTIPWNRYHDYY